MVRRYIVAREGWLSIGSVALAAIVVSVLVGFVWSLPIWILVAFTVQFFRDPECKIPGECHAVVAPAHGRVVAIERVNDPYLKRDAIKISIFMTIFSVHSNRIPADGVVNKVWYFPGKFLNAALDKSSDENERNAVWIQTDEGCDLVVVQIAGLIARRILCYARERDKVVRGQRYGFIKFGSRLDTYLPIQSKIEVQLGYKVKSGSDIIGYLPSSNF